MKNEPIKYAKCIKCRRELPSEGFVDGLCATCLIEKHYCEDCSHYILSDNGAEYSRCDVTFSVRLDLGRVAREFENKFAYCETERTEDQCEKFRYHTGA